MLANDEIGNHGRLGNQMFQYAALRGLAAKHNYDYCLPPDEVVGEKDENCMQSDGSIFDCFKLPEVQRLITGYPVLNESGFEFDDRLWNECPDSVSLMGYFQSEKYFKHIESEIRAAFTFVDEIRDNAEEYFQRRFGNEKVISVHIRRGDYLRLSDLHPVQGLDYYAEGLSLLPQDLKVLIFSDGIEWCKNQELFMGDRFFFSEGNSTGTDLLLQSLCSYHIIANSSFSWWGAWLADSESAIAPRGWFGGKKANRDMSGLYRPGWIILGEKLEYKRSIIKSFKRALRRIPRIFNNT